MVGCVYQGVPYLVVDERLVRGAEAGPVDLDQDLTRTGLLGDRHPLNRSRGLVALAFSDRGVLLVREAHLGFTHPDYGGWKSRRLGKRK